MPLEQTSSRWRSLGYPPGLRYNPNVMWHLIYTAILVLLLPLGGIIRYAMMAGTMKTLRGMDIFREWLGFLLFFGVCAGAVALYWVYPKPITGFLSLAILLTYIVTTPNQFPIYRSE